MAEDERQILAAAEALLSGSINSQRSSYTQQTIARTPDIVLSEDLVAGARRNGRMSDVRRFFCLFVTFDLLLTILMWLICTMIAGESLQAAFVDQIVHYHVTKSLFDIVMAAICRFTVLLLFYALLYMNHWIIVAISTAVTCAFLIAKVFLFDWTVSKQPVFQVLLIVTSFVLAWAEAWFFDFRVIPQETHARNWIRNMPNMERTPLLQDVTTEARQYNRVEPIGTFFTPVESPDYSDTEDDFGRKQNSRRMSKTSEMFVARPLPAPSQEKIDEYQRMAYALLQSCYEFLTSKDWKVETTMPNGDIISYLHIKNSGRRIVKITGIIDAPASKLVDWLFDEIETLPTWNKLVTESTKIQQIDINTDIVYQATGPQGGGIIDARDFIILRHRNKYGNYYISSGASVSLATFPVRDRVVRGENGVSCWAAEELPGEENSKCRFIWILNTNLKGWLPRKVVDRSLSSALIDFMSYLRKHLHDSQRLSIVNCN